MMKTIENHLLVVKTSQNDIQTNENYVKTAENGF